MRKSLTAPDPDAYVLALTGWRRACVETLRAAVRKAAELEETVKWGHLVYAANGPVLLIRAEDERVALNRALGDPTKVVKKGRAGRAKAQGGCSRGRASLRS